jgi:hypothetical protein
VNKVVKLGQANCLKLAFGFFSVSFALLAMPQAHAREMFFTTCVRDVYLKDADYPGPRAANGAAEACLKQQRLKGSALPFYPSTQECFARLMRLPLSQSSAQFFCEAANSASRGLGAPLSGNTIIVLPQPTIIQPSKPMVRRCFHVQLNQQWDPIHCSYNNGMFEWRNVSDSEGAGVTTNLQGGTSGYNYQRHLDDARDYHDRELRRIQQESGNRNSGDL